MPQPIANAALCCVAEKKRQLPAGVRAGMPQPLQCSLAVSSGTRNAWLLLPTSLRSCGRARGAQARRRSRNSVFAWRGLRPGSKMRVSHRHPARVSTTLLHKDSSLYDAMRAIIGAELRSKLDVPKVMPSYLDDLLQELDDRLGSDQAEGSTHSERPMNR
jgi:hypothetical protein